MAYFDTRTTRRISLGEGAADAIRVAALLALFVTLSVAVAFLAPATGPVPDAQDWHGNVAASGTIR
jgi:hypothetical protein